MRLNNFFQICDLVANLFDGTLISSCRLRDFMKQLGKAISGTGFNTLKKLVDSLTPKLPDLNCQMNRYVTYKTIGYFICEY